MFQHIIELAAYTGNTQFEALEKIADNVANINTSGYKAKRFEHYIRPDGRVEGAERIDYSQGDPIITNRELDVAVSGNGFIPVTQPDGKVAYTRDGSFAKNSEGYLMTNRGDLVGEGIQLPLNYDRVMIDKDGTVKVTVHGELEPKQIGRIQLVQFNNPEGLELIGDNKLLPTEASGLPVAIEPGKSTLKQGMLERANVDMYFQVDNILRLNAAMISNFRIIKFSDDLFRQAANLKQ